MLWGKKIIVALESVRFIMEKNLFNMENIKQIIYMFHQ